MTGGPVTLLPISGIPEVREGDDLAGLLLRGLDQSGLRLQDGDVLVVSSKVVSKAMGLRVPSDDPRDRANAVLRHTNRVVAERRTPHGVTRIVEAAAGPVMAAAGIDTSNTGPEGGMLLLPADPDQAARSLYGALSLAIAPAPMPSVGVLISDTAGRPWRAGQVDFALGSCGLAVLDDLRGSADTDGRELAVTARAVADEIAAAADLVKGKAEGVPAALVRGLPHTLTADPAAAGARTLVRTGATDWFALGPTEAVRSALGAPPGTPQSDAVGIPSVEQEDIDVRLRRAFRLAVLDSPWTTDLFHPHHCADGALTIRVDCPDPAGAGRLAARLEVALFAESLPARVVIGNGSRAGG